MKKNDNQTKVLISFRTTEDIIDFVDSVATSLGLSRNSALNLIIRQYLIEHPENFDTAPIDTVAYRPKIR